MKTWLPASILLLLVLVGFGWGVRSQENDLATPYVTNTPFASSETPLVEEPSVTVRVPNQAPAEPEASPIRINSFSYQKNSHQLLSVTAVIENIADVPQHGFVWYILAPPNGVEPWNEAAFVAPEMEITLQPGEENTLTFDAAPETVTPGDYRISVWVHRLIPETGERVHSDGLGGQETLFVGPPFLFSIQYVDLLEYGETTTAYVTFFVRNNTADSVQLALSYSISSPNDPTPWETGIFNLPFKDIVLDPNDPMIVTYRSVVALEPDKEYQVTAWLHRISGETQSQIGTSVYSSLIKRGTS